MSAPVFPDILIYAIPFFVAALLIEYVFIARRRKDIGYNGRDGLASVAMGLGMTASDLLMGFVSLGLLMFFWQFRFFDLGHGLPVIVAAFIIGDFKYYWKHRFFHTVRYWWMSHNVHHSSEHYNLSTALRQPWTNHIGLHVIMGVPMVLLGFHPLIVAFSGALNLLYQFWIHTEVIDKMPKWFEAVMNTPSHHRVHHGRNLDYLDMNYAGTFIIWDKMFGTFTPEVERPDYGIVHPLKTYNPITIAFHELVSIVKDAAGSGLTLGQRFKYIFGPPGYSHDGSRQTVTQMRAAQKPEA
ncbi:MAG: sterol desaturase family protein [Robiginitomaculum sp.]